MPNTMTSLQNKHPSNTAFYLSDYELKKSGAECLSDDSYLGDFSSVEECANACANHEGCRFFVYGYGDGTSEDCWKECTETADCTEGWKTASYNFYELHFH